ncbi:hypothetical protein [Streptomyces sp. NPDC057877]|uniref:hypothetical protein n=1 Tax=Streptomyces sp. NPDC057877 TaxID=3346269 RepID=UPI00367478A4
MAEQWPPTRLYGVWVVADYRPPYGWVRPPYARLTCPHGCLIESPAKADAVDVARLIASLHFIHARRCPGPRPQESR